MGLPERPGSQQRHFLEAPKDVFVCSVLIYVQRFYDDALYKSTLYPLYLLTYLLTYVPYRTETRGLSTFGTNNTCKTASFECEGRLQLFMFANHSCRFYLATPC